MSRAEKQRRRRHRKEAESRAQRRRWRQGPDGIEQDTRLVLGGGDGAGLPRNLRVVSYDISYEPLPIPKSALDDLASHDELQRLYQQTLTDPDGAILRISELLLRVPDQPVLLNWLGRCHSALGDPIEAERLARLNFARNPDYLFARINLAQFCLMRDELDEIPVIFDQKYDLKLLYPHRSVFHVSEVIGLYSVMVEYYARTGEERAAHIAFDIMEKLDPDHEEVQRLRLLLCGPTLLAGLRRLLRMTRRGRLAT